MSGSSSLASARKLIGRTRVLLWMAVALAVIYVIWRFESILLPQESCSPLNSISAGSRLWIDRRPSAIWRGDVVLFRDPQDDQLLLGRIVAAPAVLPAPVLARMADGAVWIEGDNESCAVRDSRLLGPINRDRLVGRMLFVW